MPNIAKIVGCDKILENGNLSRHLQVTYQDGQVETWPFPNNSMTVIRKDGHEAYDWYGRPVQFDQNIKRIVCLYGSNTNGKEYECAHETFIVEKPNGKLAIATLYMRGEEFGHQELCPWFKQVLTGHQLFQTPQLQLRHDHWQFDRIDYAITETPILRAFFNKRPGAREKQWAQFIGVGRENDPEESFVVLRPDQMHGIDGMIGPWVYHSVAERSTILSTPKGKEPDRDRRNYLTSEIITSDDGKLLTTTTINYDGQPLAIATDLEVVQHMAGELDLYWYPVKTATD